MIVLVQLKIATGYCPLPLHPVRRMTFQTKTKVDNFNALNVVKFDERVTYINSFKLPFYGLPLLFVRYTRRRLNSKRVKREYLHKEKQQKKTFSDKSHRKKRNTVELLKSRVKLDT